MGKQYDRQGPRLHVKLMFSSLGLLYQTNKVHLLMNLEQQQIYCLLSGSVKMMVRLQEYVNFQRLGRHRLK